MATRMQQRRGTAAQWTSTNSGAGPILNAGEIGWESDTNKFKIGDGTNTWAALDYFIDADSTVSPSFGTSITFEGSTNDGNETTLIVVDPTADRTIYLPNASGTVITTGNLSDITDIGVFTSTIVMEGSSADASELTLSAGNPTADRTITFPDVTGTVALAETVASSLSTALESYVLTSKVGASTDGVAGLNSDSNLLVPGTKIIFEGTVDGFETEFSVTNPTADVTLSFPNATDTIVGRITTDTLTNKTLTSPKINEDVIMSATATELNILDGATLSTTELNYVDGVTSAIQTQIDLKSPLASPTFTGTVNAAAITTSGDVVVGDQAFVGTGASTFSGAGDGNLTNPAMVVRFANGASEASFAQMAFQNNDPTSSTDIIAYADNGNDTSGWTDMGMTGSTFSSADYTITAANDGYMFVQAPLGNLRSINNKVLASNVATLTTSAAHGYAIGDEVVVSEVDATFNGTFIITAVTSTTFSYAKSAGNVASAAVSPVGSAKVATGNGNLVLATGENGTRNKIVFAAGGLSTSNTQMEITPDESVHIEIATPSTSPTTGALTVVGGVGITGDMNLQGDLDVNGTVDFSGVTTLPIGTNANTFLATLTNPVVVVDTTANDFAQIAFQNRSAHADASTDIIAYSNTGSDTAGYIDMGITSSAFSDVDFTITGPGDGYIFVTGATGGSDGGNLVLATGDTGSTNKIIFAAGGLASNNEQMTITPDDNVKISIATPSTSATTGALQVVGGVGIQGDMNVDGNVNIEGTITFGGAGTTVETANLNVTDPAVFVGTNNQSDIVDLAFIGEYATTIGTITKTVSNKALTSNVATLTTSTTHTYLAGDVVVVSGVDATFNGTYNIIAVPTTTTFTYAKTATNVSSAAASGSAAVSARRKFAGIARDASDGVIKAFKDATTKPTSTVNFSEAGLAYSDLQVAGITASSITVGDVTNTEFGYLDGVTSSIQTQIGTKLDSTTAATTYAPIASPVFTGIVSVATSIEFEGSTADSFETTLTLTDPTADRTITLPNATGTVSLVSNAETLTNKTMAFSSNTITGTISDFNTALTDQDFATLAGTETLTNKTLTLGNNTISGTIAQFNTAVTDQDLATLAGTETLTNKTITAPVVNLAINAQTGTTYTFVLTDNGKFVTASNASSQTYTIPPAASVAYAIGAQINLVRKGAGAVAFAAGAGVTIRSTGATPAAPTLRVQYSTATCIYEGSDIWYVVGDIS
jgi:cytoskeletal protein CcmA (bactofilin family)